MGKQGYNGKSSNKFTGGSNRHHGGSLSQSGQQRFGNSGQTRKPKYTPPRNSGPTIGDILFGSSKGKKKRR